MSRVQGCSTGNLQTNVVKVDFGAEKFFVFQGGVVDLTSFFCCCGFGGLANRASTLS